MNQRLNTRATGLTRSLIAAALLRHPPAWPHKPTSVAGAQRAARPNCTLVNTTIIVRETSPGLLDKFSGVPVLEQTVAGAMQQRGRSSSPKKLHLHHRRQRRNVLDADAAYPLIDRTKASLPRCCGSPPPFSPAQADPWHPRLHWASVPTGKPGQLRGGVQLAPRCPGEVELVSPSGWRA